MNILEYLIILAMLYCYLILDSQSWLHLEITCLLHEQVDSLPLNQQESQPREVFVVKNTNTYK